MDYYEKTASGGSLSGTNFDWKAKGYQGFMGFGVDEDGKCCEDCICADKCLVDCVYWYGKKPVRALYNSNNFGFQVGGFQMECNLNFIDPCAVENNIQEEQQFPYKIFYEAGSDTWIPSTSYLAPFPNRLRNCVSDWQRTEDEGWYWHTPCDDNEDFTTLDTLRLEGSREYTSGCRPQKNSLNAQVQLFFVSTKEQQVFDKPLEDGTHQTISVPAGEPGLFFLDIYYSAYVSSFNGNACLDDPWGFNHIIPYDPDADEYTLRSVLSNPSTGTPLDHWHDITIQMQ